MYCAISGEIPQQPVVSRKTGHLFERRLIEKALQASENRCPVTGEELKPEDLLPVACDLAQRPRPLSATSLPAMLAMFQTVRKANFKRPSIWGLSWSERGRVCRSEIVSEFEPQTMVDFHAGSRTNGTTSSSSPTRRASNCTLRGEN